MLRIKNWDTRRSNSDFFCLRYFGTLYTGNYVVWWESIQRLTRKCEIQ